MTLQSMLIGSGLYTVNPQQNYNNGSKNPLEEDILKRHYRDVLSQIKSNYGPQQTYNTTNDLDRFVQAYSTKSQHPTMRSLYGK